MNAQVLFPRTDHDCMLEKQFGVERVERKPGREVPQRIAEELGFLT